MQTPVYGNDDSWWYYRQTILVEKIPPSCPGLHIIFVHKTHKPYQCADSQAVTKVYFFISYMHLVAGDYGSSPGT